MGFIKQNLLTLLVVPLLILLVAGSFYRFVILKDYMVTYEIDCNPSTESCYLYCEDETCTEPHYYAYMEKYAATVHAQCGPDITGCDAASECLQEDGDECTFTYCDPEAEECAEPTEMIEGEGGEETEDSQNTEPSFIEEISNLESSTTSVSADLLIIGSDTESE